MNIKKLRQSYEKNGHCKIENFFTKEEIKNILEDLENIKDGEKYLDEKSVLRRVEQVAYKKETLKNVNNKILAILEKIFGESMVLFKDKYNVKPPRGEGFYAHYDGIFIWKDENGIKRNGWHEYAQEFFNVLIAIDKCDEGNGTLEVANEIHSHLSFDEMLKNTKENGTPQLKEDVENSMEFHKINLNSGDMVLFSNRCPHRSEQNPSDTRYRRILYYTYNKLKDGDNYEQYFKDKKTSNKDSKISKALSSRKE